MHTGQIVKVRLPRLGINTDAKVLLYRQDEEHAFVLLYKPMPRRAKLDYLWLPIGICPHGGPYLLSSSCCPAQLD